MEAPYLQYRKNGYRTIYVLYMVCRVFSLSSRPSSLHDPPPLSSQKLHVYFSTRSYVVPLIVPPLMAVRTFLLKPSRLLRRSSAASLFNGSEALGSKNKNCNFHQVSLIARTRYPTLPLYGRPRAEAHVPVLTCSPTMTAFRFNTGFQSSRRMFKQTLPSRSILGW